MFISGYWHWLIFSMQKMHIQVKRWKLCCEGNVVHFDLDES